MIAEASLIAFQYPALAQDRFARRVHGVERLRVFQKRVQRAQINQALGSVGGIHFPAIVGMIMNPHLRDLGGYFHGPQFV